MNHNAIAINKKVSISLGKVIIDDKIHLKGEEDLSRRDFSRRIYDEMHLNYPKFHKMDSFCRLGFLAGELLCQEGDDRLPKNRVGMILFNRYSSIDTDLAFYDSMREHSEFASPSLFVYTLPNILMGELSIRHQFTGEQMFYLLDNFDVENIKLYIHTLFQHSIVDALIVGHCEVTKETYETELTWVEEVNSTEEISEELNKQSLASWFKDIK